MSDTVFAAGPPNSLAWLKTRFASLLGGEGDEPAFEHVGERRRASVVVPDLLSVARRLAWPAVRAGAALAALGAIIVLGTIAMHNLQDQASTRAEAAPTAADWHDIIKPVQIYSLEAPEFAGASLTYTARRHQSGGGREDVLTLGTLAGDKAAIRIRIFRRAAEGASQAPLFAALAHEAAQVGLSIGRSGLPDLVPTRFGAFEVVDVALARKDGTEAPCSGFRLSLDTPGLLMSGLACGRRAAPLGKAAVGCLIERLDVASARDDRELIDLFARSELHRNAACAGMRLGPDGVHAPWLDDKTAEAGSVAIPPGRLAVATDKPVTSRKRVRRR